MLNLKKMPVLVTARSEAKALVAWTLRSWVQIRLRAWVLFLVFLCCVTCIGRGLCGGLIARSKESCRVSKCIKKPSV
jgi:hypothetical protein